MATTILTLHFIGAAGLGVTLIGLIVAFVQRSQSATLVRFAKLIAAISALQTTSGVLLVVLSTEMSVLRACANLAIYWVAVFAAELAIVMRLQRNLAPAQTKLQND